MHIISFANQKGGVGKTTTAVTLSHGLARLGKKVLLVDLDPQGHVAFSLGFDKQPGLYRLICENAKIKDVILNARENFDILPSDKFTEKVKRHITLSDFRESILLDLFEKTKYDFILLDLAPSLDVLHLNGLVASDWVMIPTRLDALAVDGVNEILSTMGEIRKQGYPFLGYSILPTFFDRTTRETLVQLKELVQHFGPKVMPPIPQDTRVRESVAYGKTLWEYSPNSTAIQGYNDGNKSTGGYDQVLHRLLEIFHG
ncbi:MAG: ParA family protein [Anaerolineaceae bacterium]|nr:ParA family protein [Anaerolineaceae bacterium]